MAEAAAIPPGTGRRSDAERAANLWLAGLAERMRVEVAIALADVIRSASMDRLRVCGAEDCDGLLLDLSRNGSKVFCSVRCGNRVNHMAYRARAVEQ